VVAPFAFATERVGDIVPSARFFLTLAYSVVLVSIGAYLLWFHILKVSGATAASSCHFLMPPLGILFGWILLGEHFAPTDAIGILPVALAIYLVTRAGEQTRETQPARMVADGRLSPSGVRCASGRGR